MKFSQIKLETPYLELDGLFYDQVEPTPLLKPYLISASNEAAKLLGVTQDLHADDNLVNILNGTFKLYGSKTFAMCYAGHQFGHFIPRLGDGRAINLGKINGQNLQLKGSGLTLYSRHGDGRAVLRSSVREYLISEAMHGLGIETTRALALIGSETNVAREKLEKGAIVLRISPTWIRFGTFEYFNAHGEIQKVQQLADYVIHESFPELISQENMYMKMFAQIVQNTAKTIANWQSIGFNHGVMNTDNMAIDGRTIDYGPFAFLDDFKWEYVCNDTDAQGRYSFKNQPHIAYWNLSRLAIALSSIVNIESANSILEDLFFPIYEKEYLKLMKNRLGLFEENKDDFDLLVDLLVSLEDALIDYNQFFRDLSRFKGDATKLIALAKNPKELKTWLERYEKRLQKEQLSQEERMQKMLRVNPKYILKNHILQLAIEKAQAKDFSMINDLLEVAHDPYKEHKSLEYLCIPTPKALKNIRLSCSS